MRLLLATLMVGFLLTCGAGAQTYKPGDKVEFDSTSTGKYWTKGTVIPFRPSDWPAGVEPDGSWYRVKADATGVEYYCKPQDMRASGGQASNPAPGGQSNPTPGGQTNPAPGGQLGQPDREILKCPVPQSPVKNGSAPNPELCKKLIRCQRGEKPADPGLDGAVTVDISALQIGQPRPWHVDLDFGSGKPGTVVYPVKATFTTKTWYRTSTVVEENCIRIFNFYVNALGEWAIGSQEHVRSSDNKILR